VRIGRPIELAGAIARFVSAITAASWAACDQPAWMRKTSKPDRNATHQERTMFNLRTSLLALAAVATLATAFVTSTSSADARPGMGGFRGGMGGGMAFRGGMGGGFRHGGMGFRHAGLHHRPHFHHRPHWHHRHHRFVRWHRPWIYGVGAAVAAPVYAPAPVYAVAPRPVVAAPNPCTCLSKEYTQDGMVVFQDRCTNEAAAAPIGGQQQTQVQPGVAPAPQ
jgi:hypothetical protein